MVQVPDVDRRDALFGGMCTMLMSPFQLTLDEITAQPTHMDARSTRGCRQRGNAAKSWELDSREVEKWSRGSRVQC